MTLNMQDQKTIAVVGECIYNMALGDVHRSLGCDYPDQKIDENSELRDGQCLVGSVMLAVALIEAIGNHRIGGDGKHTSEVAFSEFSDKYLRKVQEKYVTKDLWQVLRNGLLHNYSTKHNRMQHPNPVRYALIKNGKDLHLEPVKGKASYFYFNIQSFISDVDRAANLFLDELERESSDAQNNTKLWVTTHEAFTVFPQTFANNGIILMDMVSAVMPPEESSVQFTNFIVDSKIVGKHRIFEQPKWTSRESRRSRGGNWLE